jgi:hypothetical protein
VGIKEDVAVQNLQNNWNIMDYDIADFIGIRRIFQDMIRLGYNGCDGI